MLEKSSGSVLDFLSSGVSNVKAVRNGARQKWGRAQSDRI